MKPDINCDLGESEPPARTRALMRCITSANIACGGHAGDARTMERCILLAKKHGVRIGAHPGPWSRADAGRGAARIAPCELELLLLHQLGALESIARRLGARLHHIKLHGALYHAVEKDAALARRYAETVSRQWPRLRIYARAGGECARIARTLGCRVWDEAFADRGYRDDGSLVPRGRPGALITDARTAAARVLCLAKGSGITAETGRRLALRADTVCVHGDTPGAVRIARAVHRILRGDTRSL